jgi:hypothetical protein
MRKYFVGVSVFVFGAFAASAIAAFGPTGPAAFQINALTQSTSFHQVSSKTNTSATSTNIMTADIATVGSAPFTTADLLTLLTNSFNTPLPAGSQIGFNSGNLVVVDAAGTNVVLNPSPVLTNIFNVAVASDKQSQIETINQSGTSFSGNFTQTVTYDVIINYNDASEAPGDGIHSNFQLRGLLVEKVNLNLKTNIEKINFEFQVSGGGSVHGVQTILNGTIKGNAVGIEPVS